jgi:biotin-(acetyl-CoA carboxylase) ligase
MPDESRSADVEKLLAEEKAIEVRKQSLIADLLKQREAAIKDFDEKKQSAMKDFDEKLAKLGHRSNSPGRGKRSHHRKPVPAAETKAAAKAEKKS